MSATATATGKNQDKVFVMYAGSLVKIFENVIGPAFQNESGYSYVGEGKGSVQVSNLVKDGFRTPDVFVSAGTLPMMRTNEYNCNYNYSSSSSPSSPSSLVDWLLKFGSAEIVVSYTSNSPYFGELEKARKGEISWYYVISQKDFKFGRTDPEQSKRLLWNHYVKISEYLLQ